MHGRTWICWGALVGCLPAAVGCDGSLSPQAQQLLTAGCASFQKGDYSATIQQMDAFLRDNAASRGADEAYYLRGLAKYKLKDLAAARSDLGRAMDRTKIKPLRANAASALGDLAWDQDDLPLAERMYRQALDNAVESQPPSDQARYRLGTVLQRQGRWEDADLQFERVIYFFGSSELGKLAARRVRARAWTVQAGSYQKKAPADAAAAQLRTKNLPAQVESATEDGRLVFLVQVGRHGTYEQALAALPAVRQQKNDAFVTVTR